MPITVRPRAYPSGNTLILDFLDGSGNPTDVSNIQFVNEVQSVYLTGPPS